MSITQMEEDASGLIRATGTPLDDYILRNIFGIFSKQIFKKSFKIF
jgi:hypothetical protein